MERRSGGFSGFQISSVSDAAIPVFTDSNLIPNRKGQNSCIQVHVPQHLHGFNLPQKRIKVHDLDLKNAGSYWL